MAQAKFRLFFIGLLISFGLYGCAAPALYVAGSLGATEYATAHVTGGSKVSGKQLRENVDFSEGYHKHIKWKTALDHSDWTCYPGKGSYVGQELCLVPAEAKKFSNKSRFDCRTGSGGQLVQMYNRDYATVYCTKQQST